MKEFVKDHFRWVSVDETTDAAVIYIANGVSRHLDWSSDPYFIVCMKFSNHATVAHALVEALKGALDSDSSFEKMLLLFVCLFVYLQYEIMSNQKKGKTKNNYRYSNV